MPRVCPHPPFCLPAKYRERYIYYILFHYSLSGLDLGGWKRINILVPSLSLCAPFAAWHSSGLADANIGGFCGAYDCFHLTC